MTWVDWTIVAVMVCSVFAGLVQGFFRTACSLIGLLFGLSLAMHHYARIAAVLLPFVRVEAVANAIGFFFIAILVGVLANIIGNLLGSAFDRLGLGCVDKLGGALLGIMQGIAIVILGVVIALAFFPNTQWLTDSRLPRQFFAACRTAVGMGPDDLADRVRRGLQLHE